jgi:hypothetical protein
MEGIRVRTELRTANKGRYSRLGVERHISTHMKTEAKEIHHRGGREPLNLSNVHI